MNIATNQLIFLSYELDVFVSQHGNAVLSLYVHMDHIKFLTL